MKDLVIKIEQTGTLMTETNSNFDNAFAIPISITSTHPKLNEKMEKIDTLFDHHGVGWELINSLDSNPIEPRSLFVDTFKKAEISWTLETLANKFDSEIQEFANHVVRKSFEILEDYYLDHAYPKIKVKIKK